MDPATPTQSPLAFPHPQDKERTKKERLEHRQTTETFTPRKPEKLYSQMDKFSLPIERSLLPEERKTPMMPP